MRSFMINNKFENIISQDCLKALLKKVKKIAYRNTIKFQEYFPNVTADDGIYKYSNTFYDSWHGGWWTGIYYMAYEAFEDEKFRHYAENLTSRFYSLIKNNRIVHSEMGFIYLPICVPDIRINRSSEATETVILAAKYMLEAFGSFHGSGVMLNNSTYFHLSSEQLFQTSTLINTYIMKLAAKINGNPEFTDMARFCDESVMKYNITGDGKCYMEAVVDKFDGNFRYMPDSCASYGFKDFGDYTRGYAWATLGLALHYEAGTGNIYEEKLYDVITYFLNVSEDNLCVLVPGDENGKKIKDTTSLAIFVCALCELVKKLDTAHPRYDFYYNLLGKWFNVMISYSIDPSSGKQGFLDNGILLGGSAIDKNEIKNSCNVCGDYFYLEALMHMTVGFESCWNTEFLFEKRQEALA